MHRSTSTMANILPSFASLFGVAADLEHDLLRNHTQNSDKKQGVAPIYRTSRKQVEAIDDQSVPQR